MSKVSDKYMKKKKSTFIKVLYIEKSLLNRKNTQTPGAYCAEIIF